MEPPSLTVGKLLTQDKKYPEANPCSKTLETATNNSGPYMHHHSLDLRQFPPNVKERLTKLHNALKKQKR